MSPARPLITNRQARRIRLAAAGLMTAPHRRLTDRGLLELIDAMGYVQLDSIQTVERAHHHILFARSQTYRQAQLSRLAERDGTLFENWTHDAAVIPSRFYPYWRHRFERERDRLSERWRKWRRDGFEAFYDHVLARIRDEGALMARDFGETGRKGAGKAGEGWWDWHPEKTALEYLWRTGALAVARREGFQKVYDLPERVLPAEHLEAQVAAADYVDWKCRAALDRLGFATSGEIAEFWGGVTPAEAAAWCRAQQAAGAVIEVAVAPADGSKPRPAFARPGLPDTLADLPDPPARLRALSPFDPLIRGRAQTERIFGFHYRIEIFVPAAKRQYGYYVFPLLEGNRLVGRIDMKHDRDTGVLGVKGLWWEDKVWPSKGRLARLDAELERIRRFTGAESLDDSIEPN